MASLYILPGVTLKFLTVVNVAKGGEKDFMDAMHQLIHSYVMYITQYAKGMIRL